MEFFNKAKAVRLKSHLDKYLVADDDELTVRQSNDGASKRARWLVEFVQGNPHVIRLKSCHGRYLTASDDDFLLGMTGKKVIVQAFSNRNRNGSIEWEPIKEGHKVKLRTKGGKFLRANGATIPWRNSITHDLPHRTATQDWVMWEIDVVDVSVLDDEYLPSNASSFASKNDDFSCPNSPSIKNESTAADMATDGGDTPKTSEHRRRLSFLSQKRWPSIGSDKKSSHGSGKLDGMEKSSSMSGKQDGMEFFNKAKSVRLQSHLGKYLVADDDEETVRQSRNGASHKARWTVEFVDGKRDRIRLKSSHGLYLTAADEPFVLRMTGKKVLQTLPEKKTDVSIEWVPIKEGLHVKLMTSDGKFLRANGGAPPWRNSVTHDVPHRTATQNWVLWGVDIMDFSFSDPDPDLYPKEVEVLSPTSSISSLDDCDYLGSPDTGSPRYMKSNYSGISDTGSPMTRNSTKSNLSNTGSPLVKHDAQSEKISTKKKSGMEFFRKAQSVRLRNRRDKYLTAHSDEETVIQDRSGSSKSVKWTVEFVEGVENVVRLKSCYGKYLQASDEEFLLGVTGRKVVQALPRKLDSSVEWEPIRDGMVVKLKTRYGNFLRGNGGLPPWRNSITHDIPHRHHDWILWEVDVVEIRPEPIVSISEPVEEEEEEEDFSSGSFSLGLQSHLSSGSYEDSPRKSEGRLIHYYVADDDGEVEDAIEAPSFQFKGHGLEELTLKLEEVTGLEDIIVCSRNIVTGKLYPLRLALPPNNATMNVVVIPASSTAANQFMPPAPASST